MSTITIEPRTPEHHTFNITTTDERGNVSRQWIDLHELLAAAAHMADALSEAAESATHFNCGEAESVAAVLRAAGHSDAAETWIEGHATDDDEGDDHYREGPEDVAHREAGKCGAAMGFDSRCPHPAEDHGYCTTHAHLAA